MYYPIAVRPIRPKVDVPLNAGRFIAYAGVSTTDQDLEIQITALTASGQMQMCPPGGAEKRAIYT
jgi:hypothetical protein